MLKFFHQLLKVLKDTVRQEFVDTIERLKAEFGISNTLVAKRIGVSKTKVFNVKKGIAPVTKKMLTDLRAAFPELQEKKEPQVDVVDLQQQLVAALNRIIVLQDEKEELADQVVEGDKKIRELEEEIKRLKG